ncbi:MAG TPA: hypothetical protein VHJ78_09685 [Actinomycetota bacterium]|nr:hypothetical protein [Actinomycetota bacterium]
MKRRLRRRRAGEAPRQDLLGEAWAALRSSVLDSAGALAPSIRHEIYGGLPVKGAMGPFLDAVRRNPTGLGRPDVDTVKAAGHSEDEIFEATLAAALGEADRVLQAGLRVLPEP